MSLLNARPRTLLKARQFERPIHSDEKDCKKLSGLGHFLKGSSATLGVVGVRDSCESIQHYGNLRDEKTGKDLTSEVALSKISVALREAEKAYKEAKKWLRE